MSQTSLSPTATQAPNLAMLFLQRVEASADKEAFRYPENGGWTSVTWSQAAERVDALAAGLLSLGIAAEDRIGIASTTRFEWILADLAIMCAGAATTTVYPSTNAEDTAYILADSESRIVFAEDDKQVGKLAERRGDLPNLAKVVVFDGAGDGDWVITLDDLAEQGAKYLADHPSCVRTVAEEIPGDRLATLIYTSGTTGKPKGVRLRHEAWVYTGAAISDMDLLGEDDLQLLWLPLAHAFGKVLISTQLACGFATAIDGRVDKIVENTGVVKPTFMGAAPRIFEKAYSKIVTQQSGFKAVLFNRAFAVGKEVARRRREGKFVWPHLQLQQRLFDQLVFAKIRDVFGGRIRFFVSGSAPLNRDIAEWFEAAGLLILEGYGLTESSGAGFINRPNNYKLGTVGLPFEGTEVRISDAGEVQFRSDCVMAGYHHLDDATAKALSDDGWLSTGDQGKLDDDGFLTITGRIKELFKLSNGKYVAPPAVEAKFATLCPYASQFMVFGEGRNFAVALVTLDADSISGWAKDNGLGDKPYAELTKSDAVHNMIDEHVQKLNASLNRWETIKKWAVLSEDLSVEGGQLTPSLKVKRGVVAEQNKETLNGFYS
ncbi:long-chain fatty acid--CoA ligase [Mycobacterium sp.]|jgi:long-chain acyl-CoA synthetase|uniref:AMP-dependent synthetase/ligase n=1 Tax=Mycobacterium sp. TaxID=1785 RepID=UPI002B854135|nr:long-chain fatty acid--CoA ligase [Mycobacterium sp.]HXB85628.1 long-chain fatty acid--CoA ligase [Mycobacterium sp.]